MIHALMEKWRKKFQSHAVTLTLIRQCPISNTSELFSYTTICSRFKWTEALFFSYHVHRHTHIARHIHTHTHTYTQTDTQTKMSTV